MNPTFRSLTSLIRRPAFSVGVPLALALAVTPWIQANDNDHGNNGNNGNQSLVGTWITNATLKVIPPGFPADGQFQALETFNSDGTMFVVSQIPGVTIGNGVWKSTGHDRYTFTFSFYRPDPSSPQKMLAVVVNENVRMTGQNSYQTTDVIMPLDAAGNPLNLCGGVCLFPGLVQATRYPFANFNQVLP